MEASTKKPDHPDVHVAQSDERPEVSDAERAVRQAGAEGKAGQAGAKVLSPEEQLDALDWLLSDETEEEQQAPRRLLKLNVGTDEQPKIIDWVITTLDAETFNQIRAQARLESGNRQVRRQRGRGRDEIDFDVTVYNQRVVAAATVEPDLDEAVKAKFSQPAADPLFYKVELLKARFRNKPILLDQVAGEVMLFSGADEDDVVRATPEVTMVRAAGNLRG
jgi:hypothetical protein